jgi:nucleoside-diphosphate-sugar epimerase
MKYFMTGITGFIGSNLARQLATDGHQVNALIRSKIPDDLKDLKGISFFNGDLFDLPVLDDAMKGCQVAFHLAALAKPWAKDPLEFTRINVQGAVNVFEAALKAGVGKVVFTSSAATMSPSNSAECTDEDTPRSIPLFNEYETTKAEAERMAREYCLKGLPVVIVNPSRVFGPGPLNTSNSTTKMIAGYVQGNWRIIPGDGQKIGNYVFIDDVVYGHLLAAQKGRAGERYILGGDNLSFDEFFLKIGKVAGRRRSMVHLPLIIMKTGARLMELQNKLTGIPPLITAPWVKKYLNHWSLSSGKAVRELGYTITPFETGVKKTLEWLENQGVEKIVRPL